MDKKLLQKRKKHLNIGIMGVRMAIIIIIFNIVIVAIIIITIMS